MAELVFFSGTMDCGKSTLALQTDHTHAHRGRRGVIYTRDDRAGGSMVSSRLGLSAPAVEVTADTDFWADVARRRTHGAVVDYLVCDEAQFYSADQVDQLARIVDEMGVDVFAFGITTDFRTRLFPGSARLIELADRVEVLQVRALCWCGRRATHNARTLGGQMVTEGEQVLIGDTSEADSAAGLAGAAGAIEAEQPSRILEVAYEVLCRRHHMRRMTAAAARAVTPSPDTLTLDGIAIDVDACAVPRPDQI